MRSGDSGIATADGSFTPDQYTDPKYATRVANDPVAIWQHKYYPSWSSRAWPAPFSSAFSITA
mgnify:CR=1 FL=1